MEKVRYAVVGLGNIAQTAVLPGFAQAGGSELVALVTSDEEKRTELAQRYGVQVTGSYEELERILARSHADAVYLTVPNALHRTYTERCARAGVHVLCEKPMATTVADCRAMIDVCDETGVKLMIAYRLHFDPANLHVTDLVRSGRLGEPRLFQSYLTHQVRAHDIRTRPDVGGGALFDAGVYPINAARYLFQEEPIEVFAYLIPGEIRMPHVDASDAAILRFPNDRLAQFLVSQRASNVSAYHLVGEVGDVRLEGAYQYALPMAAVATISGAIEVRQFPRHDQFGAEIEYFSRCILEDQEPEPSGEEGLLDVRVCEALERSAREWRPVELEPMEHRRRPTPEMAIDKPGVDEPRPLNAPSPQIG
jgi:predicted dehydrogenase